MKRGGQDHHKKQALKPFQVDAHAQVAADAYDFTHPVSLALTQALSSSSSSCESFWFSRFSVSGSRAIPRDT